MLMVLCAAPVSANSGPGHWESGPAYGMVPTNGCPITVEKEDLTFQIKQKHMNYSDLTADVTASYHMKNPTAKPLDVEMVFPLISNYEQVSVSSSVKIIAAGKEVPYKLYLTGPMPKLDNSLTLYDKNGNLNTTALPTFETMLKNVKPASSDAKTDENRIFLLDYKVSFAANSEQDVTVSYPAIASMDDLQWCKTFTFAYLSNPAKNWASFQNLNVTVTPPGGSYDLSSNNIGLKKDTDGNYKVSLAQLPQNDIAFAFHDKTADKVTPSFIIIGIIFAVCAIFLIVFIIVKFHPFKRKSSKS